MKKTNWGLILLNVIVWILPVFSAWLFTEPAVLWGWVLSWTVTRNSYDQFLINQ